MGMMAASTGMMSLAKAVLFFQRETDGGEERVARARSNRSFLRMIPDSNVVGPALETFFLQTQDEHCTIYLFIHLFAEPNNLS